MEETNGLQRQGALVAAKLPRSAIRMAGALPHAVLWFIVILPCPILSQQGVNQGQLESSHISPTLYFPSDPAESSSRAQLQDQVPSVSKELSQTSDEMLVAALDRTEALISSLQTHAAFLKVAALEDTQNQAVKVARNEVSTDVAVLRGAMEDRLRQLSPQAVRRLGRYAYLARTAQLEAAHGLSPDALKYRGVVVRPAEQSISDAYDRLMDGLPKEKDISSSVLDLRRAALARRNTAYDLAAPETATLLAELIELENLDASAMGYRNAADREYQDLGFDEQTVDRTLNSVRLKHRLPSVPAGIGRSCRRSFRRLASAFF